MLFSPLILKYRWIATSRRSLWLRRTRYDVEPVIANVVKQSSKFQILMLFLYIFSFLICWQISEIHAAVSPSPFFANPSLQKAASLLQSFQNQVQTSENKRDRALPVHLTQSLYNAGHIVTGQDGVRFSTDPHRHANEQQKKLYITIAFVLGYDMAARWRSVSYYDIAAYFEKNFGFKEGYFQHLSAKVLQSNRPHYHCFLMTVAALVAYQATMVPLATAFMYVQAHYVSLNPVIMANRTWLEALLHCLQKENVTLYPSLVKIHAAKNNLYYLLKGEAGKETLEIPVKPLHFTRLTPLTLTPWNPNSVKQLKDLLSDCACPTRATMDDFSHKVRSAGFIVASLEEAQNIFIALWFFNPSKGIVEALLQNLDHDLYEAFSEDRRIQDLYHTDYSGTSVNLNQAKPSSSVDENEKTPLLFLQIADRPSTFIEAS